MRPRNNRKRKSWSNQRPKLIWKGTKRQLPNKIWSLELRNRSTSILPMMTTSLIGMKRTKHLHQPRRRTKNNRDRHSSLRRRLLLLRVGVSTPLKEVAITCRSVEWMCKWPFKRIDHKQPKLVAKIKEGSSSPTKTTGRSRCLEKKIRANHASESGPCCCRACTSGFW